MPAILESFCLLFRVEQRHHALVELRVRLDEVDDVERVLPVFPSVPDLEVEPLGVVLGIVVWL